jgi:hypothetical protein
MVTVNNSNPSPSTPVQQALEAIALFEKSSTPSLWQFLDKATIIAEMRSRVSDPFKINQGQQPFCGPTSILFELVRKQPLRYVQICQSLFTAGYFQAKTKRIDAPERLRQSSKDNLLMGQADWLVLATLRQAESLIFPVDPDAPTFIRNLSGMSFSWEMKGWVREILGYSQSDYLMTYKEKDLFALRDAANTIKLGGVAFALITAKGLLGTASTTEADVPVAMPNHWVTVLGNVVIKDGKVSFDVYTWGRKMTVNVDEASFKRFFWGMVIGLP